MEEGERGEFEGNGRQRGSLREREIASLRREEKRGRI